MSPVFTNLRLLVVVHDLEEDPRDELAVVLDQARRHLRRARHPLKLKRRKQNWLEAEWLLGCVSKGEARFTQPRRYELGPNTSSEIGKKAGLFAKLRKKQRMNATWLPPFSRALYV